MKLRLLLVLSLPLAAGACANSGVMVGGPGMQVGIPMHRTVPAFGDTVADRLYFGRDVREGCATSPARTVSDSAWATFLREVVSGRFPDGLTVYAAEGQWREGGGRIVREQTFVLEVVHPAGPSADADFREIAAEYRRRFCQQSVMRVTTPARQRFYD
jgi:hypothetical protein